MRRRALREPRFCSSGATLSRATAAAARQIVNAQSPAIMPTPPRRLIDDFIAKAIAVGADAVHVESRYSEQIVFAFKGSLGVGIGSLRGEEGDALRKELWQLRRRKPRVEIDGVTYSLSVSTFENFGETAFRVEISKVVRGGSRSSRAR